MEKILSQRADLSVTMAQLTQESENLNVTLRQFTQDLTAVEREITAFTPVVEAGASSLKELLSTRERVQSGVALLDRKAALIKRRIALEEMKKAPRPDRPKLSTPGSRLHDFCKTISQILTAWEFPGDRSVSFDEGAFDLRIDGKLRTDNGKGVRAIVHAAFKVALLMFCEERGLPHPGFVVLDSPLLTYRDPLATPKLGELTDDEKALARTPLKQRFFEYLKSVETKGQFIILENIDPPRGVAQLAHVEVFSGRAATGRYGFFPLALAPNR